MKKPKSDKHDEARSQSYWAIELNRDRRVIAKALHRVEPDARDGYKRPLYLRETIEAALARYDARAAGLPPPGAPDWLAVAASLDAFNSGYATGTAFAVGAMPLIAANAAAAAGADPITVRKVYMIACVEGLWAAGDAMRAAGLPPETAERFALGIPFQPPPLCPPDAERKAVAAVRRIVKKAA